jgi:hypothetical protein
MEQREYVRRVLEAYRSTPGTAGVVRRADRLFAAQLYDEGVSLTTVENAFLLAAARRSARAADAPPPGTIRSLAYFAAVIGEVLQLKLARNTSSTSATDFSAPLPPDSSVRLPSIPQTSTGTRLRRGCLENGAREFWVVDSDHRQIKASTPDGRTRTWRGGDEIPVALAGNAKITVRNVFD